MSLVVSVEVIFDFPCLVAWLDFFLGNQLAGSSRGAKRVYFSFRPLQEYLSFSSYSSFQLYFLAI